MKCRILTVKIQYHIWHVAFFYFWSGLVRTLQKDAEKYIPHWQWSHLKIWSDFKTCIYFLITRIFSITILLYTYCSNLLFLVFISLWSSKEVLEYFLAYSSDQSVKQKKRSFIKHLLTDAVLKWWRWKNGTGHGTCC